MPTPPSSTSLPMHRLRAGTAARLAGLPVTTLRVWERRYGVVAAAKSANGQRLYGPHDVARLRLLRQLTLAGHAIGTIAALDLDALQALVGGGEASTGTVVASTAASAAAEAPALELVVVGRSAADVLASAPGLAVRAVHDDLAAAEAARSGERGVDVLLVRVASLQPAGVDRILALGRTVGAGALFVVYAFGTATSARRLQEGGAAVRREPVMAAELAQWIRGAPRALPMAPWPVQPRRFADDALARFAEMPSPIACECLRHMSEIVAQLGDFERYSDDCGSASAADAELHRRLSRLAGAARTAFEQALESVVAAAGSGNADAVDTRQPADVRY